MTDADVERATPESLQEALREAELEGRPTEARALPGLLVLRAREAQGPWMGGALSAMNVSEVLGFANSAMKSCTARFTLPGGTRKTVWFRDGQVVFAASTDAADRLGGVLLRSGKIVASQLDEVDARVQQGRKLGRALVEAGAARAPEVYAGVAAQVREIVLGLFEFDAGEFLLHEPGAAPPSEVKLTERTRELLLEGIKRSEQASRLRAELPDDAVPLARLDADATTEEPSERIVLASADGERTVGAIIETARIGGFYVRKALAALLGRGVLELIQARAPAQDEPPVQLEEVSESVPAAPAASDEARLAQFAQTWMAIVAALGEGTGRASLELFLLDPPQAHAALLGDVELAADGSIDVEVVVSAARRTGPPDQAIARACAALDELLVFALFEARDALSAEELVRLDGLVSRRR